MTPPDLTVVIPVFNRGTIIRYTLESVLRASSGFNVETIVIDDGSTTPVAGDLTKLGFNPLPGANALASQNSPTVELLERHGFFVKVVRQENQGLLFARLRGVDLATGKNIMFLDSDDLIGVEKIRSQLTAMDLTHSEVSYSDVGTAKLEGDANAPVIEARPPCEMTSEAADFFIRVQPPPHSPIFRSDYLREVVRTALFPPSTLYNCVAEIWFYYNAAVRPAKVAYVPGVHTIIGTHAGERLTNHWERLGVASLGVLEAFARSSLSNTPEFRRARTLAGEAAFRAWRALPSGVPAYFSERLLGVARRLGTGSLSNLGGPSFQIAARIMGPVGAARLFKCLQRSRYEAVRTLTDVELSSLVGRLPPP